MNQYAANRSKNALTKPNYALRRAVALGIVALASGAGIYTSTDGGSGEKVTPYQNVPTRPAVIPEGGGARDAVVQVDPAIANNAWKSPEAAQRLDNLEHFIESKAPDGILQAGEVVQVPVLPAGQNPSDPSK